jgi:WD40 repeat protein
VTFALSPDGRRLVGADGGRGFHLWDTATGERMLSFGDEFGVLRAAAFSADGRCLVAGDGEGRIWGLCAARK